MGETQNTPDISTLVDSRILSRLSAERRASIAREVLDLAEAVAWTPLSPAAEPSSYFRTMASYATDASS